METTMPDDPNTTQAKALADALLPHLIESLKTSVLPGLVEEQISGLKTKTTELLDEVKKERTDKDAFAELVKKHEAQMATAKALTDPPKPAPADQAVTISRSDARSRSKYLEAEALAAKRGTKLQIVDDRQDDRPAHKLDGQTHLKTDTHIFVHKDAMRDRATYLRLEGQAKREHLTLQPITDWNHLPDNVNAP